MGRSLKVLALYIAIIFILQAVSAFLTPFWAQIYLSLAIVAMGLIAIFFQKVFHRGKFLDMGFRLNRNALIGVAIGLLYPVIILGLAFWVPMRLGYVNIHINDQFPGSESFIEGESPLPVIAIILAFSVPLMLLGCLFGEELTWRGYILPKLEERWGAIWAIVLSSALFGLWHLPAYFSVYKGGTAEEGGWAAIAAMLLGHGVSVVPLCILYLTTRELYGVSLYHALVNVFQYSIVMNPAFGETSKLAVYRSEVVNETAVGVLGWIVFIIQIPLMLALCALARKFTIKYAATSTAPPSVDPNQEP